MFGGEGLPFNRHSDVLNAFASDTESLTRLVEELKRRGNTAFQQKSFEEADALYSKAIEVNSSDPLKNQHIFFANRSAARTSMGKTQLALEDADACVRLEPSYAKGYFRKAQALSKLKRYRDALAALQHAQALEPANKSVTTLLAQVEALAKQQKDAPVAAPTSPKKVTRVEVVSSSSSSSSSSAASTAATTTSSSSSSSVERIEADDDDEKIVGAVRGYKKLADGRVTTFFNNELTDEAKQLIGDIAPKKVTDVNAVQIKSVEGGSAWNVGNTFEERDMTAWAKSTFETLFAGVSTPLPASAGVVSAGAVRDITGDASIAVVRGAKRYIFDFAFTLACSLELPSGERVDGELKFLDVSSDSGGDVDAEAVVPSRYASANGKALHSALSASSSPFRAALKSRLDAFVREYHSF